MCVSVCVCVCLCVCVCPCEKPSCCNRGNRAHVLMSYPQKREVNAVMADIIKHMTPDRAFEDAYPQVCVCLCVCVCVCFTFEDAYPQVKYFLRSEVRQSISYGPRSDGLSHRLSVCVCVCLSVCV